MTMPPWYPACTSLFSDIPQQLFLPTQLGFLNHRQPCGIVCHRSEGKPLTDRDQVTHYFCVFHIPRDWVRPKEGTIVTFMRSINQFSYSLLLSQTPRYLCLPPKQQLRSPPLNKRIYQNHLSCHFLIITQKNLPC